MAFENSSLCQKRLIHPEHWFKDNRHIVPYCFIVMAQVVMLTIKPAVCKDCV